MERYSVDSGLKPTPFLFRTAVLLAVFGTAGLYASMPDLRFVEKPSPEPTHPSAWDVFSPPITTSAAASGIPEIAEWTRTASPNDSLILSGHKLSDGTGNAEAHFLMYGQTTAGNAVQSPALIQRLDGSTAVVTLPKELPSWSTYLLWPKNSKGYGYPIAVNRTEAWWIGSEKATRGETVSVYGRNLSHEGGTSAAWVYVKPAGGAGVWATVTSVNPYRVQFTVPASLKNGTHEVWVHNGHGGSYGWSSVTGFAVTDPSAWNGKKFNVRDYGALGNGTADDTDAIKSAQAAALSSRDATGQHPTLFFPQGTYLVREGISLASNIRYLGEGIGLTKIKCSAEFGVSGANKYGLMFGNGGTVQNIEVKDLTLDGNGNFRRPVNQDHLVYCQFGAGSSDIRFTNVQMIALVPGIGSGFFNNISRLKLTDCEFIGGGVMLFNGRQHDILGCSFYAANDSGAAIIQRGTSDVSISECYLADYDIASATGQGLGRFLAGNGDYGTQQNIYVGDNVTVDCGPRAGAIDENSGEHVMFEGNNTLYEGVPTAATASTVTFSSQPGNAINETAVVVGGKGRGQSRRIVGFDSKTNTITVAPVWNVIPDAASRVIISRASNRCVVYRNSFDGKADYATRYTAMTGIEPFGGCYDWIGDSNTITNMRAGLYVASMLGTRSPTAIEPCYFHYYANNVIRSSYQGIVVNAAIPSSSDHIGLVSLGHVFRRNTLSNIATTGIVMAVGKREILPVVPPMEATVFEYNALSDLARVADLDFTDSGRLVRNSIFRYNTASLGSAKLSGSFGVRIGADSNPAFEGNAWTGFETTFAGSPPGGTLELPIRTLEISAVAGGGTQSVAVEMRNSGTGSLKWSATAGASWLTFSTPGSTIAENSRSSVTITCNPQGLQPGTYRTTLNITAGSSQTQQLVVYFTVSQQAKALKAPVNVRAVQS